MLNERVSTAAWVPQAQAALRIVAGYLFVQHGSAKLFGVPHVAMFDHLNLVSMLGLAGVLELVGGALVLLGLFTRPAAFILSGEMAVAYFMDHFPQSFWPIVNQGDNAILYCWVFFFLVFAGPGAWSLDAVLRRKV
jgi:putative oxidoreductase